MLDYDLYHLSAGLGWQSVLRTGERGMGERGKGRYLQILTVGKADKRRLCVTPICTITRNYYTRVRTLHTVPLSCCTVCYVVNCGSEIWEMISIGNNTVRRDSPEYAHVRSNMQRYVCMYDSNFNVTTGFGDKWIQIISLILPSFTQQYLSIILLHFLLLPMFMSSSFFHLFTFIHLGPICSIPPPSISILHTSCIEITTVWSLYGVRVAEWSPR